MRYGVRSSSSPGRAPARRGPSCIAHLVQAGLASARTVTAITFTRKAAAELKERLAALLPGESALITATTFHAFGLELLRALAGRAGLPPDFKVLDETARPRLLQQAQ